MRKFLFGLGVGVLFSMTSAALAADNNKIEALISKTKYLFNGDERSSVTLNIDGTTYAPIRFLADNMGSIIDYDASTQTISVNYPSLQVVKSEINSSSEDDKFILSLYSEKSSFKQTDYLNVWSTLKYKGEESIHLTHNYNIISFYIVDEKGNKAELGNPYMTRESEINKGDEFKRSFPIGIIQNYNNFFSKQGDLQKSAPKTLPPGKYLIGIVASYLKNSTTYYQTGDYDCEKTTIRTELPITIE
ncbi:stalk domain-containing protein [Paenibacillus sp. RC67]|uniref:stalk domain-containing protein n=1 Tax=Paenibacillus sp. RC67 TaxID=3039392 RepID=UPI0024ACE8BE|nr:stalk domain-containing protein [Paenibacillus sp. RC67]